MQDFIAQLVKQLGFLERSASLFDNGYHDEAFRIATTLRVLFHQTKQSTSLLTHLKKTDINLLSRGNNKAIDQKCFFLNSMIYIDGLGIYAQTWPIKSSEVYISFDNCWSNTVHVIGNEHHSRKSLTLAAANKDGGAHVENSLPSEYVALSKSWIGIEGPLQEQEFGPIAASLRTMAFEVLHSPELVL